MHSPLSARTITCAAGLSLVAAIGTARAADMPMAAQPPVFTQIDQSLWIVTVTGNVQATPRYPGSGDYTGIGYPSVSIRPVGTPERFTAPDDGISFSIYDGQNFRIGPTARYVPGRYYGDDRRHLFGLRDARFAIEPGVFAEFYPVEWLRARAEIRHGVIGHHGLVGSVGLDVIQPLGAFRLSIGPRFNFGDDSFARRYFGVTPIEALANGRLNAYRPDSFTSVGGLAALTYRFNQQWAATGYVGYARIVGDSADSPLVRRGFGTPNQFTFGAKVDYSFTMPALF